MTDGSNGGIDRREVLKRIGGIGAASVGMTGSSVAAGDLSTSETYYPSYTPDWYATHANVVPIDTGCRRYEWDHTVSPPRKTCAEWGTMGFEVVDNTTGNTRAGYGIKTDTYGVPDDDPEQQWEDSSTGPSAGEEVIVWAHGWQKGGLWEGDSAKQAVRNGKWQADLAWDGIDYEANELDLENDVDHTIGWAWNSNSANANFRSAVSQAHRIGPKHYSTLIMDLADRLSPGGTLHLGAHSLGAWMTLEALAEVYIREGANGTVADVLDSVRFICGAVPSSAVRGDPGWTNIEGHWSGFRAPGDSGGACRVWDWDHTYSPPRKVCQDRYETSRTYDQNALHLPDRVINGYYPCDGILSTNCCDSLSLAPWEWFDNVKCGSYRTYMKYFHNESASIAIGTNGGQGNCPPPTEEIGIWENKLATEVGLHTGSYKHPDASNHPSVSGPTGGGQRVLWPSSRPGSDVEGECNADSGGGDGGDSGDDGDGGYGGGGGGGGGGTCGPRREPSYRDERNEQQIIEPCRE